MNIVRKLDFTEIYLKQNLEEASEIILTDRKHLDRNPTDITKKEIIQLLKKINDGKI